MKKEYNELVSATECARILTHELDRPVKRPYLSKLAADERIPYCILKDKKLFNPIEVLNNLPSERMTSSKYCNTSKSELSEKTNEVKKIEVPTDKIFINHFKANGFKFGIIEAVKNNIELSSQYLPKIEVPTVIDIKKELSVLKLSKKQKMLITDGFIEKSIIELSPSFEELNTLWSSFMSLTIEEEYKKIFDTNVDEFTDSQIAYIKYLLLDSFSNAELIATCIEDKTYYSVDNTDIEN